MYIHILYRYGSSVSCPTALTDLFFPFVPSVWSIPRHPVPEVPASFGPCAGMFQNWQMDGRLAGSMGGSPENLGMMPPQKWKIVFGHGWTSQILERSSTYPLKWRSASAAHLSPSPVGYWDAWAWLRAAKRGWQLMYVTYVTHYPATSQFQILVIYIYIIFQLTVNCHQNQSCFADT